MHKDLKPEKIKRYSVMQLKASYHLKEIVLNVYPEGQKFADIQNILENIQY